MSFEKYASYVKPSGKTIRDTFFGMALAMSNAIVEAHPGIQQAEVPAEASWGEGMSLLWEQTRRSGVEQAANFYVSGGENTRWEIPYIKDSGSRSINIPGLGEDLKDTLREAKEKDFIQKVCIIHTHPSKDLSFQPASAADLRMVESFRDGIPTKTEMVFAALEKNGIWYYGDLNNRDAIRLMDDRRVGWVSEVEKEHPEIREEIRSIVDGAFFEVSDMKVDKIFAFAEQLGLINFSGSEGDLTPEKKKQMIYDIFISMKRDILARTLFEEDKDAFERYKALFEKFDSLVRDKQNFRFSRSLWERTNLLDRTVYQWIKDNGDFLMEGNASQWEKLRDFYRQESFDVRFVPWNKVNNEPVCAGLEYDAGRYFE